MSESHKGACFCGAVTLEVSGAPQVMGYCHCEDCRSWSAGPVNAFSLWAPDAVRITSGADKIATFNKTPQSARKFCRECGGHLYSEHPEMGLSDVYAATLPTLEFKPAFHVFYSESVLRIADGLPKFRDMSLEAGGSGELMNE